MEDVHVEDDKIAGVIDLALAAIGHSETLQRLGPVRRSRVIETLLNLRESFAPRTIEGVKQKILRDLETHVRLYDMIYDDLWDRPEPIEEIYGWCADQLGRDPSSIEELYELIADAIDALELG